MRGKPIGAWRGEILGRWNPREDFSFALLHAERLTRLLADVEIARVLLGKAAGIRNVLRSSIDISPAPSRGCGSSATKSSTPGGPLLGRLLQAGAAESARA